MWQLTSAGDRLPSTARRPLIPLAALLLSACDPPSGATEPTEDPGVARADIPAGRIIYTVFDRAGARAMSIRDDGTGARPVFEGQPWTWVVNLAYSPDRRQIVFSGGGDLHVAGTAGAEVVRLESESEPMESPRWSPDGRHVLATQFPHTAPFSAGRVWVFSADGASTARLPVTTTDLATWTRDGLVNVQHEGGAGWSSVRLDGTVVRHLTSEEHIALRQALDDSSPDGTWRAFVSPASGLYVTRAGATAPKLLYARGGLSYRMRWSPDGGSIAVLAGCGPSGLAPATLVVVSLADGSARTIAENVFCRGGFDW